MRVEALGTVGGFGLGSDLQWESVGRTACAVDERIGALVGWRRVVMDFEDDRPLPDMTMSGPFVAMDMDF